MKIKTDIFVNIFRIENINKLMNINKAKSVFNTLWRKWVTTYQQLPQYLQARCLWPWFSGQSSCLADTLYPSRAHIPSGPQWRPLHYAPDKEMKTYVNANKQTSLKKLIHGSAKDYVVSRGFPLRKYITSQASLDIYVGEIHGRRHTPVFTNKHNTLVCSQAVGMRALRMKVLGCWPDWSFPRANHKG